jgi:hypothetical protein
VASNAITTRQRSFLVPLYGGTNDASFVRRVAYWPNQGTQVPSLNGSFGVPCGCRVGGRCLIAAMARFPITSAARLARD